MNFNTDSKVKDAPSSHAATKLGLEKARPDYCGGGESLGEACFHAAISSEEILNHLRENSKNKKPEDQDWMAAPLCDLTTYIREKHHRYVRDTIRNTEGLFDLVIAKHGKDHAELADIRRLFAEISREMIMHMQKEEQILFPYIDKLERAVNAQVSIEPPFFQTVRNPIDMMMKEHNGAAGLVKQVRRLTSDYTAPEDACASFRALYEALGKFEADLHRHVHLEDDVLFPRAAEMESATS